VSWIEELPVYPFQGEIRLSLSRTRRDFHVSLTLLIAGIAVTIGFIGYSIWANSSGFSSNYATVSLLESLLGGIGGTLILIGAIFTGINWSLLRKSAGTP
jgi:type IV secretory pathway VirB2 component (pilin)